MSDVKSFLYAQEPMFERGFKHLQGKHDQHSHAGGSAVPIFSSAKEAGKWLKAEYPSLRSVSIDSLNVRRAQEVAEQFHALAQQYPEVASLVKALGTRRLGLGSRDSDWAGDKDAYAQAAPTAYSSRKVSIELNPSYWDAENDSKFTASLRTGVSTGWHPKGASGAGSVITHEFAHVMDLWLGSSHFTTKKIADIANASTVSRYAKTNQKEMFAESFTASIHGGLQKPKFITDVFEPRLSETIARIRAKESK